jgi:hypothetical protein
VVSSYREVYQQGVEVEHRLIRWLNANRGYTLTPSTRDENIHQDIDAHLMRRNGEGFSVSIKAQSRGIIFNNFYFELETQRGSTDGEWQPSWYYTGTAEVYFILHDPSLLHDWQIPDWYDRSLLTDMVPRLYAFRKTAVQAAVDRNGWHHVRGLNENTLRQQGYQDTRSGYIPIDWVAGRVIELPLNWFNEV